MERIDVSELSRKNLNLLVVFDTVAETRSATVAAQKLNITQSALSHAIGRLRVMFDDPLFVRGRTGFTLTARAAQLVQPVRETLLSLESLLKPRSFDPATAARTLRVGLDECSVLLFGDALLRDMRSAAPNVSLQLELFDHRSEQRISEGGLDVGVWPYSVSHNALHSVELFRDHFVGVIHASHPLAPAARDGTVSLDEYLAFPHVQTLLYGAETDEVSHALGQLGLSRQVAVSAATFAPSFALLFNSSLIITVPAAAALAAVAVCRDLQTFELPIAIAPLLYWMVWHKRNDRDPALTWLRGRLCSIVEQVVGNALTRAPSQKGSPDNAGALRNRPPTEAVPLRRSGLRAR